MGFVVILMSIIMNVIIMLFQMLLLLLLFVDLVMMLEGSGGLGKYTCNTYKPCRNPRYPHD